MGTVTGGTDHLLVVAPRRPCTIGSDLFRAILHHGDGMPKWQRFNAKGGSSGEAWGCMSIRSVCPPVPPPAAAVPILLKGLRYSAQRWTAGEQRGGGPTLGKRRRMTLNSGRVALGARVSERLAGMACLSERAGRRQPIVRNPVIFSDAESQTLATAPREGTRPTPAL